MMYESRTEKRIGEAAQRATLNKLGPGLVLVATQTYRDLVKGKPRLLWGTEGTRCGEYARPSLETDLVHM
jgi:hypothetical protein